MDDIKYMFDYKISAMDDNDKIIKSIYVKSIREIDRSEAGIWLRLIDLDSESTKAEVKQLQRGIIAADNFIKDTIFGGNFYMVRYISAIEYPTNMCISGMSFPSEAMVKKYNQFLNEFTQIKEVVAIEKVTIAK